MMRLLSRREWRNPWTVLAASSAAAASVVVLSACGSSNGGTSGPPLSPSTTTTAGSASTPAGNSVSASGAGTSSGPAVVETNPPGDIPDNQAFVLYRGSGFTVTVPEGWARSSSGSAAVFSDKYNNITVSSAPSPQAPTIATARAIDVPRIEASSQGFTSGAISTVQRKAGTAVLITYHAYSAVNPVTGKVASEAVERYTFWRAGTAVTLTLAAPVGSDNVDPWRKVTDSFAWTK